MSGGLVGGSKLASYLSELASKLGGQSTVSVGFLESAKYPDGTNVAQVAYWNEFGTQTSPPRPFFRGTIEANSAQWGEDMGKIAKASGFELNRTLSLMGEHVKNQLTESIVTFGSPGNAPSTIEAKGFDKPLIDTGVMSRTVDYEVNE